MRCCMPSCNSSFENNSQSDGVTFHRFPSEGHLRAAWLRAIGTQEDYLSDCAMVCSQHFLAEDIYETENGLKQIDSGAIPSAVLVCILCLDTESKLFLMSKYKLEKAYELLTGHPLHDKGNLKQTLCIQCARRLKNFVKFRDKTLKVRAILMELVEKREIITKQDIKDISGTELNNLAMTTFDTDNCNLQLDYSHTSGTKQTVLQETVVKSEENYDSISVDEDMEEINNKDNVKSEFIPNPLKYKSASKDFLASGSVDRNKNNFMDNIKSETASIQCTLCLEELVNDEAYMRHMSIHLQSGDGTYDMAQASKPHTTVSSGADHNEKLAETKQDIQKLKVEFKPFADLPQTSASGAHLPQCQDSNNQNKVNAREETDKPDTFIEIDIDFNYQAASGNADGSLNNFADVIKSEASSFQCTMCLEEFAHEEAYIRHMSMHLSGEVDGAFDTEQVCKPYTAASSGSEPDEPETNKQNIQKQSDESHPPADLAQAFAARLAANYAQNFATIPPPTEDSITKEQLEPRKELLDETKPFACQYCPFRCRYQSNFTTHMRTHTGEKPFACTFCDYKCVTNSGLVNHIRTHTGEKPYSCNVCDFKSSYKGNLVGHMRIHTGEKPFSCKYCEYKSVSNSALVNHLRTHTGEKPYACDFCEYKCVSNTALLKHLRTHTGEKRFSCEVCQYRCVSNSALTNHMRVHTGEKPFSCELCDYKFAHKSHLVRHMKTHTGEKPYLCKFCEYRTAHKDNLVNHIRTHTGERPYACVLCEYKSSAKSKLVIHMRTHTGEKPFGCDLCDFKCAVKHNLVIHRRAHAAEK